MTQFTNTIASPVGALTLIASDAGLSAVLWENDDPKRVRVGDLIDAPQHPILVQAERELREYFAGERRSFSVPLDASGTAFQKKAWAALLTIPPCPLLSLPKLRQLRFAIAVPYRSPSSPSHPLPLLHSSQF